MHSTVSILLFAIRIVLRMTGATDWYPLMWGIVTRYHIQFEYMCQGYAVTGMALDVGIR